MNKTLLGLALIAMFIGCTEKKNDLYEIKKFSYEDIPSTKHLVGNRAKVEGMLYPRVILNLKDYLIVGESSADTSFHIIDKSTMRIINQMGIMGRGPGEIGVTRHLFPAESDETLWAYQLQLKKVDKFNIATGSIFSEESLQFKDKMFLVSDFVFSSDSTYMTLLVDGNDKFVEFNESGEVINTYDTWDHMLEGKLPYNVISSIHQGVLNASNDKQYYTLASIDLDRIEILNKHTGKVTSVRGPVHHIPKFEVDKSSGYPMALIDPETMLNNYVNTASGSRSFYALYSGIESLAVHRGTTDMYCNDIFEFDYEGNLKTRYVLDTSIRYMAIDEEEGKIYGLTFGGDPDIVVFDF